MKEFEHETPPENKCYETDRIQNCRVWRVNQYCSKIIRRKVKKVKTFEHEF